MAFATKQPNPSREARSASYETDFYSWKQQQGALLRAGRLDWIAGVAQVDEPDALDDPTVLDVETGNEAGFEHQAGSRRACPISASASCGSMRPS